MTTRYVNPPETEPPVDPQSEAPPTEVPASRETEMPDEDPFEIGNFPL